MFDNSNEMFDNAIDIFDHSIEMFDLQMFDDVWQMYVIMPDEEVEVNAIRYQVSCKVPSDRRRRILSGGRGNARSSGRWCNIHHQIVVEDVPPKQVTRGIMRDETHGEIFDRTVPDTKGDSGQTVSLFCNCKLTCSLNSSIWFVSIFPYSQPLWNDSNAGGNK